MKSDCTRKREKDSRDEVRVDRMDGDTLEVETANVVKKRKKLQNGSAKKIVSF